MRIHLKTNGSTVLVPYNYQNILTSAIHRWLGKNKLHDNLSLYSFSWLNGGFPVKEGFIFKNGANFFISFYQNDILKELIDGIKKKPDILQNLKVNEIIVQEVPDFKEREVFFLASPVFIKRTENGKETHYTWDNEKSDDLLSETMRNKLKEAGLNNDGLTIKFDRTYKAPKTKIIYYNKIGNRVNICPVIIKGTPEQLKFAWNVGVGNSTGIGFGALK